LGPEVAHWPLPKELGTSLDGGAGVSLASSKGRASGVQAVYGVADLMRVNIGMLPNDERLSQAPEFTQAVACARERATAA
jgi:hypothetical protein